MHPVPGVSEGVGHGGDVEKVHHGGGLHQRHVAVSPAGEAGEDVVDEFVFPEGAAVHDLCVLLYNTWVSIFIFFNFWRGRVGGGRLGC